MRQEIKPLTNIAIISQKYVVSQIEFVSGQKLTGESKRHRYIFSHLDLKARSGDFYNLSGLF